MAEGDKGWAGAWEPNIVTADVLQALRDHAGEPVLASGGNQFGKPLERCEVNLRTGVFTYPAGKR